MRYAKTTALGMLCGALVAPLGSGRAIAQDPSTPSSHGLLERILGTGGMPVLGGSPPVFASVGDMRFGVRTDGTNPLGRYATIAGTNRVSFQECGSAETDLIPAELVEETDETCDSLPGTMMPTFSSFAAARWEYDETRDGYVVTASGSDRQTQHHARFVACSTLPASMLIAAAKAGEGVETIVGPDNVISDLAVKVGQQKTPVIANSRPSSADCARAAQFWTFDTASQATDPGPSWTPAMHVPQATPPPRFIGVATKNPSLIPPSRTQPGGGE
ncbi:hypothetical protein [Stappia sp.]|uniref:hypothetical protein n=1 Tax=Stappia sp. TaxID=1870903 RepID=UPI0032D91CAE